MITKTKKVLFVIVIFLLLWAVFYVQTSGGAKFLLNFNRIAAGDTKERVIALLGNSDTMEEQFRLGQKIGYEAEYVKAKNSDSKYFLFWNKGIDIVYAVGFDKNNKVTIKAHGGT